MTDRPVYDNYEISGCRRMNEDEKDDRQYVEVCDEADARFWTLYGHIDGRGAEAIGDFPTREAAELIYYRIAGEPFAGSYRANPRLKLMHAAASLLAACRMVVDRWEGGDLAEAARACQSAIGEATAECSSSVSGELDISALLARRRQIAAVWGIEDVQEVRPDLDDDRAWEVLQAAERGYDATIGINWDVLACHADMLYGDLPDEVSDEAEAPPMKRDPVDDARPRFPLGRVVLTTEARDLLDPADVQRGLDRHASGDWGDLSAQEAVENELAVELGERLISAYGEGGGRFLVMTEADRGVTTVFLPEGR